jgi:hypothetical protein
MNEETSLPPSRDEARAAIAAASQIQQQTRKVIAGSQAGPALIWWGLIWLAMFTYAQFRGPGANYVCWVLIAAGFIGSILLNKFGAQPVKRSADWRGLFFWLALFGYAAIYVMLLVPWDLLQTQSAAQAALMDHKMTAYFSIVPMFAYVVIGLFVERFLLWLGLLMTGLILIGYFFIWQYFYLWIGAVGGGTLIISGIYIRKFWK